MRGGEKKRSWDSLTRIQLDGRREPLCLTRATGVTGTDFLNLQKLCLRRSLDVFFPASALPAGLTQTATTSLC